MTEPRILLVVLSTLIWANALAKADQENSKPLYQTDFTSVEYGNTPDLWMDLINHRPSRNWAVDGNAFLRPMLKDYTGLIVYLGALADGGRANALADVTIQAQFKKTEDPDVFFGVAARVQDKNNFYAARFTGVDRLEVYKVVESKPELLGTLVSLVRYRYPEQRWTLAFTVKSNVMTARLTDENGIELARVDAQDNTFKAGSVGLNCTTFGAAKNVKIQVATLRASTRPS